MGDTAADAPAIDPPLAALFSAMAAGEAPAPPVDDHDARRAAANATMLLVHPGPEPGVTVEERTVEVQGGQITVRISTPADAGPDAPCLFFVHGGGWFQGNLDTAEVECGPMASTLGCVVVSVDYRLAPEHPFPTPLDDCVAAWEWLLAHADELGIDPGNIVASGTSAGANLVAALCLVARDRGLPLPRGQYLVVPATDLTLASPSMTSEGSGAGLTREAVDEYAGFYVQGDTPRDHPLVSPLHHPDLSGLPPAVVVVAEHDPVRDDGERYLAALHAAGVPAAGFRVLAHIHGSWIIPITITHRLVHDLQVAALRRLFDGTLVPGF